MARIAVLALIWGWSFLFIKVGVEGMTPTAVASGRITLGMLVMVAVLRGRRARLPTDLATWGHFVVMGLLASALPFTLLAWGEQHISSALTSVLNAATPLFAAVAAAALLHERLRPLQVGGLVLGFAGVAVAAGLGRGDLAGSSLAGAAAAVGAAACYGFTFVYARRMISHLAPMVAATGQLVAGTVLLLPVGVVTTAAEGMDAAPHRLLAVGILGVAGTGLAYVLYYQAIADVGPTKASVVTYLVPVVAVAVGVAFLGEPFQLRLLAGGALTIAGITLLHGRLPVRPPRAARQPPPPPPADAPLPPPSATRG